MYRGASVYGAPAKMHYKSSITHIISFFQSLSVKINKKKRDCILDPAMMIQFAAEYCAESPFFQFSMNLRNPSAPSCVGASVIDCISANTLCSR